MKKCLSKGFAPPAAKDVASIVQNSPALSADWDSMLGHQLAALPKIGDQLRSLPHVIAWLG